MGLSISPIKSGRNLYTVFLTLDGFGGGNRNFSGDYSVTPTEPFALAPPGFKLFVTSLQVVLSCSGSLRQRSYGNISNEPLVNGVGIRGVFGGVNIDLSPTNIFTNDDLLFFSGGDTQVINYTSGDKSISSNLNLADVGEDVSIVLDSATDDRLLVVLNDDFTALRRQSFLVRGYLHGS